jgi:dihydropyrimidinase
MTTLIRNGTVVTAQETREADVLIEGERISQVGPGLPAGSDDRVNARAADNWILPHFFSCQRLVV